MLKTGLIGRAIQASRSPWLHEQEARAQELDLSYELFDFTELGLEDAEVGPVLRRLAANGFSGVNITYPFKQSVIANLDEVADCAASVGAVNTVAMRSGQLIGFNTDKTGFGESLAEGLPGASLAQVLQLGAGGAGAAVANALLSLGTTRLLITDVDDARVRALADRLCGTYGAARAEVCRVEDLESSEVAGIVNTTPMGMAAHPEPAINPGFISPSHWVADIVYFPLETALLKVAREKGCRTLDGSGMVVGQAARAFEIFTGRSADKARMYQSFALA